MRRFIPVVILLALAIPFTVPAQRQAPRLISKVSPECTAEASEAKTEGTVVVTVTIDEKGVPANTRVVRSLEHGLDGKALESVGKWRFEPGSENGHPIAVNATIEVNFRCPM